MKPGQGYVGRGRSSDRNHETRLGKFIKPQVNGCWLYTGAQNSQGYGVDREVGSVHRFIYETLVGEIPEGYHLHHICEVKACCNPEHLEPLTPADHAEWHRLRRLLTA